MITWTSGPKDEDFRCLRRCIDPGDKHGMGAEIHDEFALESGRRARVVAASGLFGLRRDAHPNAYEP